MKRIGVMALGTLFVLSVVAETQAGLFDLFRSKRRSTVYYGGGGCCQPDPCCRPRKRHGCLSGLFGHHRNNHCCAPAPSCCEPAPTCCAPAPTCCAPADGGAPPTGTPQKPYEETPPVPKKDDSPPPPPKKGDSAPPKAKDGSAPKKPAT